MADHAHVPSPAHTAAQHVDSAVHYMWNGAIEVRMTSQSNQILVKQIFNQCKQIQCSLISVSIKNSIDIKVVNAWNIPSKFNCVLMTWVRVVWELPFL